MKTIHAIKTFNQRNRAKIASSVRAWKDRRPSVPSPTRALQWIEQHTLSTGGVRVHHLHPNSYPEVSGYLIPTLLQYGQRELAEQYLEWLLCIQLPDGSFTDPDHGKPRVFDSGQILRGLLSGIDLHPGAYDAADRTVSFLLSQMIDQGRSGYHQQYSGDIPESVLLYTLPPFRDACKRLNRDEYRIAVQNCLDYYLSHPQVLRLETLTHFLAYETEALIDLGKGDAAINVLNELEKRQAPDGAVRGVEGQAWVCSPGLAQLAICWFKIGHDLPARKAMSWLEKHQRPSGGYLGSYGSKATYFPNEEISWAVKFYLDAHLARRAASAPAATVSKSDIRLTTIIQQVQPGNRVLDVCSSQPVFIQTIKASMPDTECTSVALCRDAGDRPGITTRRGQIEALPVANDSFDVVFCVDGLHRTASLPTTIQEITRAANPGGKIVLVDSHSSSQMTTWQSSSSEPLIERLLGQACDDVRLTTINGPQPIMVWTACKRSLLSGQAWYETLHLPRAADQLVKRIKSNHVSPWGRQVILATKSADKVIEIGSGTAEISLRLALLGRNVTVLDYGDECLKFAKQCAEQLGVHIQTVNADATGRLPFDDGQFDCVWSSGLIEHFYEPRRISMLKEQARISRDRVISLVPNAGCLAYRIGKSDMEQRGVWPYGREMPLISQRDVFSAARLSVTQEMTIGAKHALGFVNQGHWVRQPLAELIGQKSERELLSMNQGYLLMTIGSKKHRSQL